MTARYKKGPRKFSLVDPLTTKLTPLLLHTKPKISPLARTSMTLPVNYPVACSLRCIVVFILVLISLIFIVSLQYLISIIFASITNDFLMFIDKGIALTT